MRKQSKKAARQKLRNLKLAGSVLLSLSLVHVLSGCALTTARQGVLIEEGSPVRVGHGASGPVYYVNSEGETVHTDLDTDYYEGWYLVSPVLYNVMLGGSND